jgi:hypothetical protein
MIRFLLVFLFCLSFVAYAQIGKVYEDRKIRSAQQIKKFKEGVLFVRIRNRDLEVEYLKKYGRIEEARKVENKRRELNQRLIRAFNANFDFCPVYFFFSHDSKHIRLGQFDSVGFVDTSLNVVDSIKPKPSYYLTAELGKVVADTAKFFGGYRTVETEDGLVQKPIYHTGPDAGFKGLIIKSDQFIQLVHPFPYYVRTYFEHPNERRMMWYVKKLNAALHQYYREL